MVMLNVVIVALIAWVAVTVCAVIREPLDDELDDELKGEVLMEYDPGNKNDGMVLVYSEKTGECKVIKAKHRDNATVK